VCRARTAAGIFRREAVRDVRPENTLDRANPARAMPAHSQTGYGTCHGHAARQSPFTHAPQAMLVFPESRKIWPRLEGGLPSVISGAVSS
jgi:hypothetical protein